MIPALKFIHAAAKIIRWLVSFPIAVFAFMRKTAVFLILAVIVTLHRIADKKR